MSAVLTRDELAQALILAGQGDRAAFRRVYEATSAKLTGVALRILGDRAQAEDVVQETYLTVWRRADTFDASKASPITWLATIARNRAIDRLRAASSRVRTVSDDAALQVADGAPLASQLSEAADDARRLNLCLDQLEDRVSSAIRTAFFEGVTYEQLAGQVGAPLGTVKSWIRRGLARLKVCLEP